ncbi:MAG: hypothetical protein EBT52_04825 [Flavobacteriia bacterium]|jgi:hypothetical protein|nr:hypothetical protein [Flavobacteriia bacterium]
MRFTAHLLIWSIATLLLHIVVQEFILPKEWAFRVAYRAHVLLWALTVVEHRIQLRLKKSKPDMIGMSYLAGAILKSVAGVVYLLPFLLHVDERTRPVALWFFLPYFSSFIFQAIQAVRIVRSAA